MNVTHSRFPGDESDEAQLTAYALDQLDAEEAAVVEALLARSPEAREAVHEIRQTGRLIRQALERTPQPQVSALVREAIEQRLDESGDDVAAKERPKAAGRRSRYRIAAFCTAAAGVALAIVGLSWTPGVWNVDEGPPEVALLGDTSGPETLDATELHFGDGENAPLTEGVLLKEIELGSPHGAMGVEDATLLSVVRGGEEGTSMEGRRVLTGTYGGAVAGVTVDTNASSHSAHAVEPGLGGPVVGGTSQAPASGPGADRFGLGLSGNGPETLGRQVGGRWNMQVGQEPQQVRGGQGMYGYESEQNGQMGSYGVPNHAAEPGGYGGGEDWYERLYGPSPRGRQAGPAPEQVASDGDLYGAEHGYEGASGGHSSGYMGSGSAYPGPRGEQAGEAGQDADRVREKNAELSRELGRVQAENREARRASRGALMALETQRVSLPALRAKVETLQEEIRSAGPDRDEQFQRLVELTDELHAAARLTDDLIRTKEFLYAYRDSLGTEQYDPIVENPFVRALKRPESTFSIDVDTASYANVRRFLNSGRMPPPNAVRIEEMVNYFRYDYDPPEDEGPEGEPFSVHTETAQCPWNTDNRLLRIALKGREIDPEQRGPSNLVFLLDVSGSMRDDNKLPLVKQAMLMLVDQLTEDDRLAIVTYAASTGVVLESTCGDRHGPIRNAIEALSAGGSTHGSAGIQLAYQQAAEHFVAGGANRVILCTDGDLNVGITDDDQLVELITQQAKTGVFLTVLGFGTGNLKDAKLEKLADHGNGMYAYVDSIREARRVLVEQGAGSLITIAKDVKIQVEFNPARVERYRLVGYENRLMAARDFDNDKKDAGEIGAGHTVTAFYEIVPVDNAEADELAGEDDVQGPIEPIARRRQLKYQRPTSTELTEAADSDELLTLRLRYKQPEAAESVLREFVVEDSDARFGQASDDFRFAAAVASFGMMLRHSQHAGQLNYSAVEEFAGGAIGDDSDGFRAEFVDLIRRASKLDPR